MLLRQIEACGFLSFGQLVRVDVDPGLTVVTGPNAAGKSNLGRCLAVAKDVVAASFGQSEGLDLYEDAGYEDAEEFLVRLAIELDQPWEQDLILTFVRACFSTSGRPQASGAELDPAAATWLVPESLAPLWSGSLIVQYQGAAAWPWSAAWEFSSGRDVWHAVLAGDRGSQRLTPGSALHPAQDGPAQPFTEWLLATKPQDENVMDFRAAILHASQPVTFAAGSSVNQPGGLPDSVRALGVSLGIDLDGMMITFSRVIDLVLRRGIVLTDNRRLPLRRHFSLAELGQPADLRDGAAVGAELYRLKVGYPEEQARFREVQATFKKLTGRDLEIRARPAIADDGIGSMIIEPTVAGWHGVRLVELSGAGMQEALVLSAILQDRPGQVTVLDEPAVNLEPTVQRRLINKIRGPGQYLVITHSADLVPFEEPGDLSRIVHVAPGPSGSQIHQPDFSSLTASGLLRQLRLLEPADVRALLFAAGVILCEGPTEVAALPRWWAKAGMIGLPDPTAANIDVLSVDGQDGFGAYLRYLHAFGVPWAVVADGPALRPDSQLADDLRALGYWPDTTPPQDRDDFPQWRKFFEGAGVYTLADQFGDDGTKLGEFEAFLERVDKDLLAEAKRNERRSKPRQGAYFALHHPDPPPEALDLYEKITSRLGVG